MDLKLMDIIFVGLLLVTTLLSYSRGFFREVLSLLGLGVGFVAASWYHGPLGEVLLPLLPDRRLAELLAYLVILLLGYFGGMFLSSLSEALRNQPPSVFNSLLGGVVGLGKGLVFSLALYWVIQSYIPPFQDELRESYLADPLGRMFAFLESIQLL